MRELDDRADLVVVDRVDDRDDEGDVDAGRVQVLDRAQLHVEEVADLAVRVRLVADAVELQVGDAQAGLLRLLREAPAPARSGCRWSRTGRGSSRPRARSAIGVEEVRRERRLAAGELHRHLPARLDRDRVVEDLLDVVQRQLVDVADLVRVHEARVAHHVAAVRQVDREHRAAAVLDATRCRGRGASSGAIRKSRPGNRLLDARAGTRASIAIMSSKWPCVGHVLLHAGSRPSRSTMLRLDLAGAARRSARARSTSPERICGAHLLDAARAERVGLAREAELREASARAASGAAPAPTSAGRSAPESAGRSPAPHPTARLPSAGPPRTPLFSFEKLPRVKFETFREF